LGFHTGYTRENYARDINKRCNSGMEKGYLDPYYVIKNPTIIENINEIILDKNIVIDLVIIPLRDYTSSAKSRVSYKDSNGGLWNATNEETQILFYHKIIADYVFCMTKYNIPTVFMDFDKMITDPYYVYTLLKETMELKQIDFHTFEKVYHEVSLISKPRPKKNKI